MISRLNPTQQLPDVAGTDLVIEAIVEDLAIKRSLFADLAKWVSESTLLASNTSYLDIDQIAAGISHPERVLGLHFSARQTACRYWRSCAAKPPASSP
ncbi:hypothetical protein HORIV_65940 [Vreelandella olivaria]|uniref:3-hydroxyacyl-CoA dehydrogenase NAD binding domain-containing protein n=1 Tax=Vreelandella olivaria TaxID=390919 RepID=A0ABN5X4K9_9GAMM|nr:hypothetical protein HORIV_65940 [Halomonas olivaria]